MGEAGFAPEEALEGSSWESTVGHLTGVSNSRWQGIGMLSQANVLLESGLVGISPGAVRTFHMGAAE